MIYNRPPPRSRNYCFTLNNYTNEELDHLANLKCKYIIIGKEIGINGTPHLQGYVIFENAKSFNAVKKSISFRAHIESIKGTPYDNFVYCSKDGNFTERGDRPERVGQGKRQDMLDIKKAIAQNIHIKQLLIQDKIKNHQQLRFAENLEKYYEEQRNWKPIVKWYWGATGTGKTKTAYEEFRKMTDTDSIYFSMDTGRWWEGYDGHTHVIVDDMRGDFLKFHQLLKLLDRYPYKVETKGSTRQFQATHIIITSCMQPHEVFPNIGESIDQLIRRIDNIVEFKKENPLEKESVFKGLPIGPQNKKYSAEELKERKDKI